jgi:hypothetical protein
MKRFKVVPILVLTILMLTGCMAGMMSGTKGYTDMTPEEKVAFVMALYNNAASEYVWMYNTRVSADGKLSENDIDMLKKYWKALDTTHTAIALYDTWVKLGTVPTEEMEDELIQIIRTLSVLAEDK